MANGRKRSSSIAAAPRERHVFEYLVGLMMQRAHSVNLSLPRRSVAPLFELLRQTAHQFVQNEREVRNRIAQFKSDNPSKTYTQYLDLKLTGPKEEENFRVDIAPLLLDLQSDPVRLLGSSFFLPAPGRSKGGRSNTHDGTRSHRGNVPHLMRMGSALFQKMQMAQLPLTHARFSIELKRALAEQYQEFLAGERVSWPFKDKKTGAPCRCPRSTISDYLSSPERLPKGLC
jgi:hypothetical protein